MIRFDLAGVRKHTDRVFLTTEHRSHKEPTTLFHRNDYHTVLKMTKEVFNTYFKFNPSTYIYDNLTGITWQELGGIADMNVFRV